MIDICMNQCSCYASTSGEPISQVFFAPVDNCLQNINLYVVSYSFNITDTILAITIPHQYLHAGIRYNSQVIVVLTSITARCCRYDKLVMFVSPT